MQTVSDFVSRLAAQWASYLGGIVLLSTFAMAILQTAKDLLPIRRLFHRNHLRHWFAYRCKDAGMCRDAEHDLVALATDGDADAFFDLATEQLCGQMSAASQVVLDAPGEHPALIQCMTAVKPAAL